MQTPAKKTILIVDDSYTNLMFVSDVFRTDFHIIPFVSGRGAIEYLRRNNRCDLILLDVEMPDMNGFDTIIEIKSMDGAKNIPVIFLTGNMEVKSQVRGLSLGAVDYVFKPFIPELVKKRVQIHLALEEYRGNLEYLVEKKTQTIEKLSEVTIETIVTIIGSRDRETNGHINRTSEYVVALANELCRRGIRSEELTYENVEMLRKSAPLHDVGKVGIDDYILRKTDRLSDEEFEEMKRHTIIGGEAFAKARAMMMGEPSFLDYAEDLAMSHHEWWDGTGYPHGLKGEEIPFCARIMAIADVYDALISRRPYKDPYPHEVAVKIIEEGSGTHFDPDICDAFLDIHQTFADIAAKFDDNK